jgi:hypothetical protein
MTPTVTHFPTRAHQDDVYHDAGRRRAFEARVRQELRRSPGPRGAGWPTAERSVAPNPGPGDPPVD